MHTMSSTRIYAISVILLLLGTLPVQAKGPDWVEAELTFNPSTSETNIRTNFLDDIATHFSNSYTDYIEYNYNHTSSNVVFKFQHIFKCSEQAVTGADLWRFITSQQWDTSGVTIGDDTVTLTSITQATPTYLWYNNLELSQTGITAYIEDDVIMPLQNYLQSEDGANSEFITVSTWTTPSSSSLITEANGKTMVEFRVQYIDSRITVDMQDKVNTYFTTVLDGTMTINEQPVSFTFSGNEPNTTIDSITVPKPDACSLYELSDTCGCRNGGECIIVRDEPFCLCTSDYCGQFCDETTCPDNYPKIDGDPEASGEGFQIAYGICPTCKPSDHDCASGVECKADVDCDIDDNEKCCDYAGCSRCVKAEPAGFCIRLHFVYVRKTPTGQGSTDVLCADFSPEAEAAIVAKGEGDVKIINLYCQKDDTTDEFDIYVHVYHANAFDPFTRATAMMELEELSVSVDKGTNPSITYIYEHTKTYACADTDGTDAFEYKVTSDVEIIDHCSLANAVSYCDPGYCLVSWNEGSATGQCKCNCDGNTMMGYIGECCNEEIDIRNRVGIFIAKETGSTLHTINGQFFHYSMAMHGCGYRHISLTYFIKYECDADATCKWTIYELDNGGSLGNALVEMTLQSGQTSILDVNSWADADGNTLTDVLVQDDCLDYFKTEKKSELGGTITPCSGCDTFDKCKLECMKDTSCTAFTFDDTSNSCEYADAIAATNRNKDTVNKRNDCTANWQFEQFINIWETSYEALTSRKDTTSNTVLPIDLPARAFFDEAPTPLETLFISKDGGIGSNIVYTEVCDACRTMVANQIWLASMDSIHQTGNYLGTGLETVVLESKKSTAQKDLIDSALAKLNTTSDGDLNKYLLDTEDCPIITLLIFTWIHASCETNNTNYDIQKTNSYQTIIIIRDHTVVTCYVYTTNLAGVDGCKNTAGTQCEAWRKYWNGYESNDRCRKLNKKEKSTDCDLR